MPRLAPLDLNKLAPEQKKVADAIMSGPRGGLRGPFEPWLRSPVLADRAQKLGEYCRFHNSLPRDLSELAICLVGRHFKAQFEFYAHARLAKEAGLLRGQLGHNAVCDLIISPLFETIGDLRRAAQGPVVPLHAADAEARGLPRTRRRGRGDGGHRGREGRRGDGVGGGS